jgi:succinyl-diaminopimelate desuccinylase
MPDALTIHALDPVAFTRALIRCPSVTPLEGGALVLLAQALEPMGGHGTWEIAWRVSGESFYTPPGELSGMLAAAIAEVTGIEPELSTTGGTSDARFIRSACPVVEFGIVGQTMHKVDERCSAADVEALSRIYERLLDCYFDA